MLTIDPSGFAANIGADEALFADVSLSGSAYPSFTVSGTPFAYDPGKGDLLMDITVTHDPVPPTNDYVSNDARILGSGLGIVSRPYSPFAGTVGLGSGHRL